MCVFRLSGKAGVFQLGEDNESVDSAGPRSDKNTNVNATEASQRDIKMKRWNMRSELTVRCD